MPDAYRTIAARFRPGHPPIFPGYDSPPTREEVTLAHELMLALDAESQACWYRLPGFELRYLRKR